MTVTRNQLFDDRLQSVQFTEGRLYCSAVILIIAVIVPALEIKSSL